MGVSAWLGSALCQVFDGVSWVHGCESTLDGVDWWTRVMGQSSKESHGFERNENKYTCVRRSKMG